jgi:hypothetical protein
MVVTEVVTLVTFLVTGIVTVGGVTGGFAISGFGVFGGTIVPALFVLASISACLALARLFQ